MSTHSRSVNYDYIFKIIIIGNNGVGKSSILRSFDNEYFMSNYTSTIGVDFMSKVITLKDYTRIKFQMWDTAGTERFRCIVRNYYRDCVGVIIIYDKTKPNTFHDIQKWYEDLLKNTNIPQELLSIVIVGNKIDLTEEIKVGQANIIDYIDTHNIAYIETSAKHRTNIDELFSLMGEIIYKKVQDEKDKIIDKDNIINYIKCYNQQLVISETNPPRVRFKDCCTIS